MIKLIKEEEIHTEDISLERKVNDLEEEVRQLKSYLAIVADMAYKGALDMKPTGDSETKYYKVWRDLYGNSKI